MLHKIFLLPLCLSQTLQLLFVALQGCSEVVSCILCLEQSEHNSFLAGVGVFKIGHLKCELHVAPPMVPSQLYEHLVFRNVVVVPCKKASSEIKEIAENICKIWPRKIQMYWLNSMSNCIISGIST